MSVPNQASSVQLEQKGEDVDDRHWDDAMPRRVKRAPELVQRAYTHSQYEAHYLRMRDGVRIAVDILRPAAGHFDETHGLPCVLIQTRYQRSTMPRWPLRKLLKGRPLDLLSQETRSWFLAAGYAVAVVDVRGTGASFGQWRAPWQPEERTDSREVIDWIVSQPWSSQQCVLWGVSYDGTATLFTVAQQHPAVKAAVPQYAFWDIYENIGLPGGIPLHSFAATWTQHCLAFDSNDHSRLPKPTGWLLPLIVRGCQPVIEGVRLGGSTGSASTSSSSLASSVDSSTTGTGSTTKKAGAHQQKAAARTARHAGQRLLHEAVRGHDTWQAAVDLAIVRCTDDLAPNAKKRVTDISACSVAGDIASSGVPLSVTAGWLDSTAGPAITMFMTAAKAPGSRLLLGPWGHGGNMYCQLLERDATRSAFPQPLEAIAYFDAACGYRPHGRSAEAFGAKLAYSSGCKQHSHTAGAQHSSPVGDSRNGDTDVITTHGNGHAAPSANGTNCHVHTAHARAQGTGADSGTSGQPGGTRQQESEGLAALGPSVRYFVMGCRPHWKSSNSWPPEDLAERPRVLYLNTPSASTSASGTDSSPSGSTPAAEAQGSRGATHDHRRRTLGRGVRRAQACKDGRLQAGAAAEAASVSVAVDKSRFLKGTSRYDVITQPTATIQYHRLRSAGHALFTSEPLAAELQTVGWPEVELWVASSDTDADVFVYLEDYDPAADVARYVTEGNFRASHRRTYVSPPAGDPRAAAHLPGMPFHTFSRQDLQPLTPGEPVKVRFVLLPTAYGFAAGHCVRVAVAGADSKHFTVDHEGDRTLWIHAGDNMPSRIILPEVDLRQAHPG